MPIGIDGVKERIAPRPGAVVAAQSQEFYGPGVAAIEGVVIGSTIET